MEAHCERCGYAAYSIEEYLAAPSHSTRYAHFLESNEPLLDSTRTEIEAALAEDTQDVANINARILQTRRDLADLFKRRAQKEQNIEDYHLMLQPHRRLPPDVLSEIFLCLVNENIEEDEAESSFDPERTLWVLPHVSRQWQAVSLTYSRLWATVRLVKADFVPYREDSDKMSNEAFMLGTQLQRSGTHPLLVSIDSGGRRFTPGHHILHVLCPTSIRWKGLHCSIPLSSYQSLARWTTSFPALDFLHFEANDATYRDVTENLALPTMFSICPNLRRVRADMSILSAIELPYMQIEDYTNTSSQATVNDCTIALHDLLNLRCLYFLGQDSDFLLQTSEINLPFLEDLTINADLLQVLRVSSLRALSLPRAFQADHLLAFLIRSKCQLACLTIEC